jgi:hypothetical protein
MRRERCTDLSGRRNRSPGSSTSWQIGCCPSPQSIFLIGVRGILASGSTKKWGYKKNRVNIREKKRMTHGQRQEPDQLNRTASRSAPAPDAGRSSFAPLPQTLASRATFRLAPSLSSAGDPVGVPCRELLRHGPPRVHANLVQEFISDYSYRSATMGSTFAARRAGR